MAGSGWDPWAAVGGDGGLCLGILGEAKTHLGLGEVPYFLPLGGAEPAQAWGLLDAVVQSSGAGGAVAHRLQVLAGDGLQSTWKTYPEWTSTHCLITRLQPLLQASLGSAQAGVVGGSKGPVCHQTGKTGNHTHLGRQ